MYVLTRLDVRDFQSIPLKTNRVSLVFSRPFFFFLSWQQDRIEEKKVTEGEGGGLS